jgi:hypothetical protein
MLLRKISKTKYALHLLDTAAIKCKKTEIAKYLLLRAFAVPASQPVKKSL